MLTSGKVKLDTVVASCAFRLELMSCNELPTSDETGKVTVSCAEASSFAERNFEAVAAVAALVICTNVLTDVPPFGGVSLLAGMTASWTTVLFWTTDPEKTALASPEEIVPPEACVMTWLTAEAAPAGAGMAVAVGCGEGVGIGTELCGATEGICGMVAPPALDPPPLPQAVIAKKPRSTQPRTMVRIDAFIKDLSYTKVEKEKIVSIEIRKSVSQRNDIAVTAQLRKGETAGKRSRRCE